MSSRPTAIAAPGLVLSQPTRHDEPVEEVAAGDELDRIGHDLPAHERGLHALGAHRDAVRDRDRVELHRRPARGPDALLHERREAPLVEVAGHRLDPRGRDADDRLGEVLVGEADGLEHRARAGAVGAVGQRGGDGASPDRKVGRRAGWTSSGVSEVVGRWDVGRAAPSVRARGARRSGRGYAIGVGGRSRVDARRVRRPPRRRWRRSAPAPSRSRRCPRGASGARTGRPRRRCPRRRAGGPPGPRGRRSPRRPGRPRA